MDGPRVVLGSASEQNVFGQGHSTWRRPLAEG